MNAAYFYGWTAEQLLEEPRAAEELSRDLLWGEYQRALSLGDQARADVLERRAREWDNYADFVAAVGWEIKVAPRRLLPAEVATLNSIYDRLEREARRPPTPPDPLHDAPAYGRAVLEDECHQLATTEPGARANAAYAAACRVGRRVGAGLVDHDDALDQLLDAALKCGLSEREARPTIIRGLGWGNAHPKGAA